MQDQSTVAELLERQYKHHFEGSSDHAGDERDLRGTERQSWHVKDS